MIVQELIELLQGFPSDADVEFILDNSLEQDIDYNEMFDTMIMISNN